MLEKHFLLLEFIFKRI